MYYIMQIQISLFPDIIVNLKCCVDDGSMIQLNPKY